MVLFPSQGLTCNAPGPLDIALSVHCHATHFFTPPDLIMQYPCPLSRYSPPRILGLPRAYTPFSSGFWGSSKVFEGFIGNPSSYASLSPIYLSSPPPQKKGSPNNHYGSNVDITGHRYLWTTLLGLSKVENPVFLRRTRLYDFLLYCNCPTGRFNKEANFLSSFRRC